MILFEKKVKISGEGDLEEITYDFMQRIHGRIGGKIMKYPIFENKYHTSKCNPKISLIKFGFKIRSLKTNTTLLNVIRRFPLLNLVLKEKENW